MFKIFELLRQRSDLEFAQILNRIRGNGHTNDDVREVKSLVDTYSFHWPNSFVKIYLRNCPASIENERCIRKLIAELERDIIYIFAKGSVRDIELQTL